MLSNHALLGPSSAKRWLNCTPSARLSESINEKESSFAAEGTEAHTICENKLRKALGLDVEVLTNLEYYSQEMEDYTNDYVSYILELFKQVKETDKEAILLVEQRLDLTSYIPESFGTGDALIASNNTLYIIDFKYGMGVKVESKDNPQMMLYALGALELFDCIYDIEKVVMTIYQPRLSNISSHEVDKTELYTWAKEVVIEKAKEAFSGKGNFSCGEWCKFCKIKATCRERANTNLALAEKEFAKPPLLTDEEIVEVLSKVDDLGSWANEIKDYALAEALKGKRWEGYKVVAGRSIRRYSNDEEVIKAVKQSGNDPFDHKLISITEMQKRLGKELFSQLLDKYIIKPEGKPTLVQESDKRPEYKNAFSDFNDK